MKTSQDYARARRSMKPPDEVDPPLAPPKEPPPEEGLSDVGDDDDETKNPLKPESEPLMFKAFPTVFHSLCFAACNAVQYVV